MFAVHQEGLPTSLRVSGSQAALDLALSHRQTTAGFRVYYDSDLGIHLCEDRCSIYASASGISVPWRLFGVKPSNRPASIVVVEGLSAKEGDIIFWERIDHLGLRESILTQFAWTVPWGTTIPSPLHQLADEAS